VNVAKVKVLLIHSVTIFSDATPNKGKRKFPKLSVNKFIDYIF